MDYFCDDFFVDFFNGVIVWLNGKAPHIVWGLQVRVLSRLHIFYLDTLNFMNMVC